MKIRRLLFALITILACGACAAKDTCFECHLVMEGMSHTFTNDVHFSKSLSCADCHGGDANEIDHNISMSSARGFKVRVQRPGVPAYCARCHSDTNFMAKYDPQLPTDQYAQYTNSIHGKKLAAGRKRAAECVDCHGIHDIREVTDPLSKASPQRISQTCSKCHAEIGEAFANSRHGRMFNNARRPGCVVCHSSHDIAAVSASMLTGTSSTCAKCHREGSRQVQLGDEMAKIVTGLESGGESAKEALTRVRIAVHGMNLNTVKNAAQPPAQPAPEAK